MIGKRLTNGRYAVPVLSAKPLERHGSISYWRLELACGHVLERHPTWNPRAGAPRFGGCPEGCARELHEARRTSAAAFRRARGELEARWRKGSSRPGGPPKGSGKPPRPTK